MDHGRIVEGRAAPYHRAPAAKGGLYMRTLAALQFDQTGGRAVEERATAPLYR
jgi:hypothetical protein